MSYLDAFKVGRFGFFKDPELINPIESENLLDQITPDGWVDIYFGGKDIYLPDYGTFQAHIITDGTFFWDILDENGNRTKEGFESLWISKNANMVPVYGDYIPKEPEKLFNWYSPDTATTKDEKLICANLWFYNNLFLDEYFRYYLICLHKDYTWPDEKNALILPMNDNLIIPKDHYIVGYRPKPEYRYQLAGMPIIRTGIDYAIHFKFKINLEYFFNNPEAKRFLSIYGLESNNLRYVLYPRSPDDIIWDRFNEPFIPQYKRFLLVHGIQAYLPSKKVVKSYVKKRETFLKYNNIFFNLDKFNKAYIAQEIKKKELNPQYELSGIASYIYPFYKEWKDRYNNPTTPETQDEIMDYILFNEMPWAGFYELYTMTDNLLNDKEDVIVNLDGSPIYYDLPEGYDPKNPNIKYIVEINGVKQFSDGWVPDSALGYLSPPPGYMYAGAIGNGMYLVKMGDKNVPVYCDMKNGGWMFIMDGMLLDTEYVSNMIQEMPENIHIEPQGIWFGEYETYQTMYYPNIKFKEMKISLVDYAQKPGEFRLEIYGDKTQFLLCESIIDSDRFGSTLILNGDVKYDLNKLNVADTYEVKSELVNNNLTIKMKFGKNYSDVIKYVKFIWVR